VLAQASRLQFSTRLFNLLVTNVPGPQVPLYILGNKLQDLFPLAFLPTGHALAVAIMSYDGRVEYGLLGDFDALPDIDVIVEGIDTALAELIAAAGTHNGSPTKVPSHATPAVRAAVAPVAPVEAVAPQATAPLLPRSRKRSASGPAADMRAKRAQAGNGRTQAGNGRKKF
jgi:hypothetical protein